MRDPARLPRDVSNDEAAQRREVELVAVSVALRPAVEHSSQGEPAW